MSGHNLLLWILQILFGIFFISVGVIHFLVPEGLPDQLGWMYDLNDPIHYLAGAAEILGGLGLILPGITGIAPQLISIAALGLLVVMLGAIIWHLGRAEYSNIATNLVASVAMAYIAYGRWRLSPISGRGEGVVT